MGGLKTECHSHALNVIQSLILCIYYKHHGNITKSFIKQLQTKNVQKNQLLFHLKETNSFAILVSSISSVLCVCVAL